MDSGVDLTWEQIRDKIYRLEMRERDKRQIVEVYAPFDEYWQGNWGCCYVQKGKPAVKWNDGTIEELA